MEKLSEKYFVFLVPHTPREYRNELRDKLFEITLNSLKQQTYQKWKAYIISDVNKKQGNIQFIDSTAKTKKEKLLAGLKYIADSGENPDYLIRFDDDDIISPTILEKASTMDFDCLSDEYHTFYEVSSGLIALQKRNWLPNTVIHKYNHAIIDDGGLPLVVNDHSQSWHVYYNNKNIVYLEKGVPLYLRILSPTSITGGGDNGSDFTKSKSIKYLNYLHRFGKWRNYNLAGFQSYISALKNLRNHPGFKPFSRYKAPSVLEYYLKIVENNFSSRR